MPTPLRSERLEALNVAIAKGEAVFSVWARWSEARNLYFVGASACFEGELYDLTDVGWVIRGEGQNARALALTPKYEIVDQNTGNTRVEFVTEPVSVHPDAELMPLVLPGQPIPYQDIRTDHLDESDEREQTFVEELGSAAEVKITEQPAQEEAITTEPSTDTLTGPIKVPATSAPSVTEPVTPEEQPIVRTPGKARQKVEA